MKADAARPPSEKPTGSGPLGLASLALGALTLVLGFAVLSGLNISVVIGFGIATLIVAIGAFRAGDPRWPMWLGLVLGVVPTLFWGLFGLGYGIIALTGCPDDLRETAQEIEHPAGVEVRWEGTERETCRAEVPTSLTAEEVTDHYDREFADHGWEPAAQSTGVEGTAATQDGVRYEVGWVRPPR